MFGVPGIVNGYTTGCDTGDPCFKPANNVTRGQTAKIVAIQPGWSEPSGAQQFEDVLPGSTFYDDIWRLADLASSMATHAAALVNPAALLICPISAPTQRHKRPASQDKTQKLQAILRHPQASNSRMSCQARHSTRIRIAFFCTT